MADAADVTKTIEKLSETAAADGWTQVRVEEDLDLGMTPNEIALAHWEYKMSRVYSVVDVSESGSSRSMSKIFDNAAKMVERYQRLVNLENTEDNVEDPAATRGPGIRTFSIRRPT